MVQASGNSTVQDFQGFRTIIVDHSASMLNSNLTSKDGQNFVIAKNVEQKGKLFLYDSKVTDATHDTVQVTNELESHKSDTICVKYIKI